MPSNANPPWHGSAAMQVEERERQRRAARQRSYADDGVANWGSVSNAQRVSIAEAQRVANEHWNSLHRNVDEELLRQLNITPQFITRQGPPPFPGGVVDAPPLPRAKVTPRDMIDTECRSAWIAASAQYVKTLHAQVRVGHTPYTPLTEAEYREVTKAMRHEIERKLAGEISRVAPTITPKQDQWAGTVNSEVSVVVMTPQQLQQMIYNIGDRIIEQAKQNGFIR